MRGKNICKESNEYGIDYAINGRYNKDEKSENKIWCNGTKMER